MLFMALVLSALAEDPVAHVTFESTRPNLTVSYIEGRGVGSGYSSGGSVTVHTTFYRDLCIAPCSVEVRPGVQEFFAVGGGRSAVATKLDIRDGENTVMIDPGSSVLRTAGTMGAYAGIGLLVAGLTFLAIDTDPEFEMFSRPAKYGMIGGGAVLGGGGLALSITNKGKWKVSYGAK